ncbi:hypothetical protein DdX_04051 [Ditylenchus destructor]|uniref:Uncharacterized protein n=1 Tax=Ditylenchus destructor TaxID=166010 RepID=A0AAD4NG17_9BILA|nr:hypothetical protein DdX_04051 [Ditylenchus destructor]
MRLYANDHQWLSILLLTSAAFLSFLLMLIPLGIFYVILLQLSKLISCMVDHLVFFYVMNLVVDSCRDETITNSITNNVPSFILARRRLRILVVAESLGGMAKMLAGLFIIQTFNASGIVSYRVPKFLFCTICYALNLLTFIVCGGIQRNDTDNQTQSQTLIALPRSDTPLAPMLPRRQHPSMQRTTSMK